MNLSGLLINRSKRMLVGAAVFLSALLASVVLAQPGFAQEASVTERGFFPPLETAEWTSFLASGCNGQDDHSAGSFSVGIEAEVAVGTPVLAVTDGVVSYVSGPGRGWGDGNVALAVQHSDPNDGALFLALYGHVRSDLRVNDEVVAGEPIGTVGPLASIAPQLHFGIQPGIRMPASNWGSMRCSAWPEGDSEPVDTNGFIDPLSFIGLESATQVAGIVVEADAGTAGRGMADTCQYDPDPCSGIGLRAGASNSSSRVLGLAQGRIFDIECQVRGQLLHDSRGFGSDIWNRTTVDGVTGYVADVWSTKVGWLDARCG